MQFSETDKSNPLLRRYRRLKLMSFITEKMPYWDTYLPYTGTEIPYGCIEIVFYDWDDLTKQCISG